MCLCACHTSACGLRGSSRDRPTRGMTPCRFLPQTCAHRYEARQRVDQILETRDVIGRCFVLSQDLAIRDELDGGEWKFCEGRPQGHEQFGFCQQGTAAAFSPDSHYLLFGAPGTYNWKGESLLGEGRREPKCPLPSEMGLGQHVAKHAHTFPAMSPGAPPRLPPPSCQPRTQMGVSPLLRMAECSPPCWHEPPHARLFRSLQHFSPTSSLPFPSPHAAAGCADTR